MQPTIPTSQVSPVPPKLPPHVRMVRNKVGRPYYYLERFRGTARAERRVLLPDVVQEPTAFWAAYAQAMGAPAAPPRTDTFRVLIEQWQASQEWRQMAATTKLNWERHCRRVLAAWGELQPSGVEPRHVVGLRDQYAHTPGEANNLIRCLSSLLSWAVPRGWRSDNPCREIKPLKGGDGYAPWPWEAIQEAREQVREDLWWALALALYTGQRQADVLAMRWDAIRNGLIEVRQEKTAKRLSIPVHRDLAAVIETVPRRALTVLTSSEGRPWTRDGFRSSWAKGMVRRPGLVFHGLRKSAVVMLLEAGCTEAEVASITGQSMRMVEHYAKQVNQGRLAAAAILKWEQSR